MNIKVSNNKHCYKASEYNDYGFLICLVCCVFPFITGIYVMFVLVGLGGGGYTGGGCGDGFVHTLTQSWKHPECDCVSE